VAGSCAGDGLSIGDPGQDAAPAERLPEPWGDQDRSGRWHVGREETAGELLTTPRRRRRTDVGGRCGRRADRRPTLARILFHVLQEYARHAGHLDITRELLDGATGE
jgi:Protein of unknown function (DUF664)